MAWRASRPEHQQAVTSVGVARLVRWRLSALRPPLFCSGQLSCSGLARLGREQKRAARTGSLVPRLFYPPLKGEGRRAQRAGEGSVSMRAGRNWCESVEAGTPARRASRDDLPLAGGGERRRAPDRDQNVSRSCSRGLPISTGWNRAAAHIVVRSEMARSLPMLEVPG